MVPSGVGCLPDAPGRVDISRPPCDDSLLLLGMLHADFAPTQPPAGRRMARSSHLLGEDCGPPGSLPREPFKKGRRAVDSTSPLGLAIPVRIPLPRRPGSTFSADLTDLQAEGSRGVLPNATGHHKGSPQPVNRRVEPNSSRPLRFTGLRGSVRAPRAAPAQPPQPACTCSTSPGCCNPQQTSAPSLNRWLPSISSSVNHAPNRRTARCRMRAVLASALRPAGR